MMDSIPDVVTAMQVVVSTKLPATPARRTLLVFYQTVLPYLTERLR